jgi:hypothetical protein
MRRLVALALVAGAIATGCGGEDEDPGGVDWDLSEGHAVRDAGLTEQRFVRGTAEVRPEDGVVVRLPGGRTFNPGGRDVDRIALRQAGGQLTEALVVARPTSLEAGRSKAETWARQVGLGTDDVGEWVAGVRQAGGRRVRDAGIGGARLGRTLGDGPSAELELSHRPGTEAPMRIALRLVWR